MLACSHPTHPPCNSISQQNSANKQAFKTSSPQTKHQKESKSNFKKQNPIFFMIE